MDLQPVNLHEIKHEDTVKGNDITEDKESIEILTQNCIYHQNIKKEENTFVPCKDSTSGGVSASSEELNEPIAAVTQHCIFHPSPIIKKEENLDEPHDDHNYACIKRSYCVSTDNEYPDPMAKLPCLAINSEGTFENKVNTRQS